MDFEWDEQKAASNVRKHHISFEVAVGVFIDLNRTERLDSDSSEEEERWTSTGLVFETEIYVVYTMRDETVRLISARRANRYERKEYWDSAV